MQGVKEKAHSILAELKNKGWEEPLGFATLLGFIEDGMRDCRMDAEEKQASE